MKKLMLTLCLVLALTLSSCASKPALSGTYEAVNPPTADGEMVIEQLTFEKKEVTMISGTTKQTVAYEIKDDKFTIKTKFGSFSYNCLIKDDGTLVIDGVDYVKQ